jgi:hypothetical protein
LIVAEESTSRSIGEWPIIPIDITELPTMPMKQAASALDEAVRECSRSRDRGQSVDHPRVEKEDSAIIEDTGAAWQVTKTCRFCSHFNFVCIDIKVGV